jgi:hypothetical protein
MRAQLPMRRQNPLIHHADGGHPQFEQHFHDHMGYTAIVICVMLKQPRRDRAVGHHTPLWTELPGTVDAAMLGCSLARYVCSIFPERLCLARHGG